MGEPTSLVVREYGSAGPLVVVVHGGPGAPGSMAPVARRLADSFRVLEPLQRGAGGDPLTVARHVADLHEVLASHTQAPAALVGHSWGAMLALAYATAHPGGAGSLTLIGCGTFERAARARMDDIREARLDGRLRRRIMRLFEECPDPDERLTLMGRLLMPVYSHALVSTVPESERCDARANRETWEDMLRLQDEGVYPAAFAAITAPVLMLHGAADPHPGAMIRASLAPFLARMEYREWERCGHYPWLEQAVHEEFFTVLREWLGRTVAGSVA